MGLIKFNSAPGKVVPFSMKDIELTAKQMLLRAQQQADQILAEAEGQGEVMRQQMQVQGRDEGYEQGLEEGREAGRQQAMQEYQQQLAEVHAAMGQALVQFEQSRQDLQRDVLREVVGLAAAVARRVTCRQSLIEPQVLQENLVQALRLVVHRADVRIVVNPAQRETIEQLLPQMALAWPQLQHATIAEDPAVHPGGCRLSTDAGDIDADINTQLDRIIAELLPLADANDLDNQ